MDTPDPELRLNAKKEQKRTAKAWERYRIKDHERGHRKPLSETLNEPTLRLDTSVMLPESVYKWLKSKSNKAAFIRETVMKAYSQR